MDHYPYGSYDFQLKPEQEESARRLHEESLIIDMVYWGPFSYHLFTPGMTAELDAFWESTQAHAETCRRAKLMPLYMAVQNKLPAFKNAWDESGVTGGSRDVDGFADLKEFADTFGMAIAIIDHLPWLIKALKADDFRQAKREGKHTIFISTQLTSAVDEKLIHLLEPAYHLGLRMVQLTYNNMTIIGGGCTERTDAGLSSYGASLVKRLNELGMIVDTGHCSHHTTLDACKLSNAPVIASHTSADNLFRHDRAKSDEELRAIAETGGVIGVLALPAILTDKKDASIEHFLDHIDYIADLVGWEHVGIGTDWPYPTPKSVLENAFTALLDGYGFRKEHKINPTQNLIGFDDYRDFINITRGLVKRGYTHSQIKGILGENFLRIFEQVCG